MSEFNPLPVFDLSGLAIPEPGSRGSDEEIVARLYQSAKDCPTGMNHWLSAVHEARANVPRTTLMALPLIVQRELIDCVPFSAESEEFFDLFTSAVRQMGNETGYPVFIKTGHHSNKHAWKESCCVPNGDRETVKRHLVEVIYFAQFGMNPFSPSVAVREMIKTEPVFFAFEGDMPVTQEFRMFARDGKVEGYQPYWPAYAVEGRTKDEGWEEKLESISKPTHNDLRYMNTIASRVTKRLGGYWSVDFLKDRDGKLWLIDMAEGDKSFKCKVGYTEIQKSNDLEP